MALRIMGSLPQYKTWKVMAGPSKGIPVVQWVVKLLSPLHWEDLGSDLVSGTWHLLARACHRGFTLGTSVSSLSTTVRNLFLLLSPLSKWMLLFQRTITMQWRSLSTARQGYKSSTKNRHPRCRWQQLSGTVGKFGLGETPNRGPRLLEWAIDSP